MAWYDDFVEDIDWGDVGKAVGGAVGGPAGSIIGGWAGNAYDNYSGNLPDADRSDDWEPSYANEMIRIGSSQYAQRRHEQDQNAFQQNILNEQRQYDRGSYQRLYEDASAAGFNPLEALRGGGGTGARPRIGTSAGMANQFDQIDAILSGQQAADRAQQKLNRDLTRVQIDEARRGGLQSVTTNNYNLGNNDEAVDGKRVVTNTANTGSDNFVPSWVMDAETAEARYSELGGWWKGAANAFTDSGYNLALKRIAAVKGTTPRELHETYQGPGAQQRYEQDVRQILAVKPIDAYNKEITTEKLPALGRINITTGDLRRARKPWEH